MANYKTIQVTYKGHIFQCEGLYESGEQPIWKPTFEIERIVDNSYSANNILDLLSDLGHLDELTELCLEELKDE